MAKSPFEVRLDLAPCAQDMDRAFERFWGEFVDPEGGIVYDVSMRYREVWPTPDEVAKNIPTVNGWDTAIENAASEGGLLLAGLSHGAFTLTPERRQECLDHLFHGLVSLWEVPGRTGFICRGYLRALPAKARPGQSFYIQTSCDQAPIYLFGLWCYARSACCRPEHRPIIAEIFQSVMRWLEDGDWFVRLYDGRPAVHGEIRSLRDPGIARYLALMLMAREVTADEHWSAVYRQFRDEEGRRRFTDISSRSKAWLPYALLNQAFALWALEQLDPDPECSAFYAKEKRLLAVFLNAFCTTHIYARFWPVTGNKTINIQEDRLIDWRPAYEFARRSEYARAPEKPEFWYTYRDKYEELRMEAGASRDGYLTCDFFSLLGAYYLCQGRPPSSAWVYLRPAQALSAFFNRLAFEHPLRFLPHLAFSLGINNWLAGK